MKHARLKMKPSETTTATLEVPALVASAITPETIRLPKVGGQDPYFGMSRSALNELILPTARNGYKPPVRSFVLRRKGARTGIRLIDFASLKNFILSHPENAGQEAE
jgi:hypothetical protein